jgi:serine/threonine-protein kinase RsbW
MALEESLSNAIRHGNRHDPGKQVTVECRLSGEHFWARICDEGQGFRPADVPNCCSPECLELPGGRGLALINAYMTSVAYNDCGNCVTLEKRLGNRARRPGGPAER